MESEDEQLIPPQGYISDMSVNTAPDLKETHIEERRHKDPREHTRSKIAFWLLGLLCAMVIFSALYLVCCTPLTAEGIKTWLTVVFNPVLTLFGTIVGFYFGSQSQSDRFWDK